jgi:hypothetical protein
VLSVNDEETDDPLVADVRNFYKVEKWTNDGAKVDRLVHAGTMSTSTRCFRQGHQTPAADQADNPATDTGVAGVAAHGRIGNALRLFRFYQAINLTMNKLSPS